MAFHYLPIHFKALIAIEKEIIRGSDEFKFSDYYPVIKTLINHSVLDQSLPKSNQLEIMTATVLA